MSDHEYPEPLLDGVKSRNTALDIEMIQTDKSDST